MILPLQWMRYDESMLVCDGIHNVPFLPCAFARDALPKRCTYVRSMIRNGSNAYFRNTYRHKRHSAMASTPWINLVRQAIRSAMVART